MSWLRSWRPLSMSGRLRRVKNSSNPQFDEGPEPLNGFLFNEKPLLPGEKRVKEFWENIWVYGMGFNFILLFVVAVFKPDTSISSWAREKALERLAEKDRLKEAEQQAAAAEATTVFSAGAETNESISLS